MPTLDYPRLMHCTDPRRSPKAAAKKAFEDYLKSQNKEIGRLKKQGQRNQAEGKRKEAKRNLKQAEKLQRRLATVRNHRKVYLDAIRDWIEVKELEARSIRIAPFHTGGLGYVAETELNSSISALPAFDVEPPDKRCEIVFTPFSRNMGNKFRLELYFRDRPGILQQICSALAAIGLNIDRLESCIVQGGSRGPIHYVEMTLDWSRSPQFSEPVTTRPSDRHRYREVADRLPLDDARYIVLYEQIMLMAGDFIVLDRTHADPCLPHRPAIGITRYSYRSAGVLNAIRTVRRSPSGAGPPSMLVNLTKKQFKAIEKRVGVGSFRVDARVAPRDDLPSIAVPVEVEGVRYLLSSDPTTRTLRALMLPSDQTLAHFALVHRDEPAAVAELGEILKVAGFNIVQSLQRKDKRGISSWELLVEDVNLPDTVSLIGEVQSVGELLVDETRPYSLVKLDCLGARLQAAIEHLVAGEPHARREVLVSLRSLDVRIEHPKYPRPRNGSLAASPRMAAKRVSLSALLDDIEGAQAQTDTDSPQGSEPPRGESDTKGPS